MSPKRESQDAQAAFVMEGGDRFHRIIVSDSVLFDVDAAAETVITFFVIRRVSGLFDIVNVNRTFSKGKPVSRTVQNKPGIRPDRIADEIDAIRIHFALGIEKATGYKLKWHELDLSKVDDHAEQVKRITAWGRVGVKAELAGIGGLGGTGGIGLS